jgi:hypothetical protein
VDNKAALIILVAMAVIGSGCSSESGDIGSGIQLVSFKVADSDLRPEQPTKIRATFKNGKETETSLEKEDVELFNTGNLTVKDKKCTPDEIKAASGGINPKMECTWRVKAPGEEYIKGFRSKPLSINLRFQYSTSLRAKEPLEIRFEEEEDITEKTQKHKETSDSALSVSMKTFTPIATNKKEKLDLTVKNKGGGELKSNYGFEYEPKTIIDEDNCPSEKEPINEEVSFSCTLNSSVSGTRKLFVTTSYKYEQIHSKNIEVIN